MSKDDPDFEWYRGEHEPHQCREHAKALIGEMARLLEKLEHVRLPEMSFSRCPSCLSPCDLSQPHEAECEWELALRKAGIRE